MKNKERITINSNSIKDENKKRPIMVTEADGNNSFMTAIKPNKREELAKNK